VPDPTQRKRAASKVYVSGSIRDIERCRSIMRDLEAQGHVITHDWTAYAGPKMSREEAQRQLEAVAACDTLVLVVHPRLKAGWMEFGAAVAQNKRVVVYLHPEVSESMWYTLPNVEVRS
jgi:hypothetical protein